MKRAPGYLFAIGTSYAPEDLERYQTGLPPVYASYGGYRLVMGDTSNGIEFLAGSLNGLAVIVSRFPSVDDVSAFWWSKDYRSAYARRSKTGRFAAVALPGLDREPDPIPGGRGYLAVIGSPEKPSAWRAFADALIPILKSQGGTLLADAGPEAIERLENLLPGGHVLLAMFKDANQAHAAWQHAANELRTKQQATEPVFAISMAGLIDGHPLRLLQDA